MARFVMTTAFGKRRGWEIQQFKMGRGFFHRMTGRTWCVPATHTELALWKFAELPFGKDGEVRDEGKARR